MTSPRTSCFVADCELVAEARGLCPGHYQRWRAHRDVFASEPLNQGDRLGRTDGTLTGKQVADAAGITYRQLDYWATREWVPSGNPSGPGSWREYDADEQRQVCEFADLVRAGFKPAVLARYSPDQRTALHAAVQTALTEGAADG